MEKEYKFSQLEYARPDFEAMQSKLNEFASRVKAAKEYETVKQVILERNDIYVDETYEETIAMIRYYLDCTDKYYEDEFLKISEGVTYLDDTELMEALLKSPFHTEIEKDFGTQYFRIIENKVLLFKNGKDEMVKEQELVSQYQQLKASLKFNFDGKVLGEAELAKYFQNPDRMVRKQAILELHRVYLQYKEKFSEILDQLVHLRIKIANENGFDNYFDYINREKGRYGYGESELTAFCQQVKEVLVPFCSKLHEAKKRRFGLNELKVYDSSILFPEGNPVPKGTTKELFEAAGKMYHDLSNEAGDFFDKMLMHEMIEVEPSQNKVAGMGFCTNISKLKMPFVFGNFNGTLGDVTVLTHEIGHAFQAYLAINQQPLYDYEFGVNDISEVPSKTMEQLTYPYAEYFFGDDADRFRFMHLSNVMEEICFYCMVHEYESWLYSNPDATIEERAYQLSKVSNEYVTDYDDSDIADYIKQGTSLFRNMGVYMFPRYLISYSLSNMCALEFKRRMKISPKETWEDFMKLCRAGGSLSYPELLKLSNLSLAYEDGMIAKVIKYIENELFDYISNEEKSK